MGKVEGPSTPLELERPNFFGSKFPLTAFLFSFSLSATFHPLWHFT